MPNQDSSTANMAITVYASGDVEDPGFHVRDDKHHLNKPARDRVPPTVEEEDAVSDYSEVDDDSAPRRGQKRRAKHTAPEPLKAKKPKSDDPLATSNAVANAIDTLVGYARALPPAASQLTGDGLARSIGNTIAALATRWKALVHEYSVVLGMVTHLEKKVEQLESQIAESKVRFE